MVLEDSRLAFYKLAFTEAVFNAGSLRIDATKTAGHAEKPLRVNRTLRMLRPYYSLHLNLSITPHDIVLPRSDVIILGVVFLSIFTGAAARSM